MITTKNIDFLQNYSLIDLNDPVVINNLTEINLDIKQISQINNIEQLQALKNPIIISALKKRTIKFDRILQINKFNNHDPKYYQIEILENPTILSAFKENFIDFDVISKTTNNNQTDALKEPKILEAFCQKIISLDQILKLNNKFQVEALRDTSILNAIKADAIKFDAILQITEHEQISTIKNLDILNQFKEKDNIEMPEDVSQNAILEKIKKYLEIQKDGHFKCRDKELIDTIATIDAITNNTIINGHCAGISILWLYAKYNETQPLKINKKGEIDKRDDYKWFKSSIKEILDWDGKTQIPVFIDENNTIPNPVYEKIENFISKMIFFQNPDEYITMANQAALDYRDSEGHLMLETTTKIEKNEEKGLKKEYCISGVYNLKQLKQLLNTPNLIQENKLIIIGSHNHATALYKIIDKKNKKIIYYYFDSNNKYGQIECENTNEVSKLIVQQNFKNFNNAFDDSDNGDYFPLLINIFSYDYKYLQYPKTKEELLNSLQLNIYARCSNINNETALHISAQAGGDLEALKYYLDKISIEDIDFINSINNDGFTALMIAIYSKQTEIIEELLGRDGINVNLQNKNNGMTALMYAAKNGNKRIFEKLIALIDSNNINIADKFGITALMYAVVYENIEVVEILLKMPNININHINNFEKIALTYVENKDIKELFYEYYKAQLKSIISTNEDPIKKISDFFKFCEYFKKEHIKNILGNDENNLIENFINVQKKYIKKRNFIYCDNEEDIFMLINDKDYSDILNIQFSSLIINLDNIEEIKENIYYLINAASFIKNNVEIDDWLNNESKNVFYNKIKCFINKLGDFKDKISKNLLTILICNEIKTKSNMDIYINMHEYNKVQEIVASFYETNNENLELNYNTNINFENTW